MNFLIDSSAWPRPPDITADLRSALGSDGPLQIHRPSCSFLKYTRFGATDQSPGPLSPTLGLGNEWTKFCNSCRMQFQGRTTILINNISKGEYNNTAQL